MSNSTQIVSYIILKEFYKAKQLIHEDMNQKLGIILEEKLVKFGPTIHEQLANVAAQGLKSGLSYVAKAKDLADVAFINAIVDKVPVVGDVLNAPNTYVIDPVVDKVKNSLTLTDKDGWTINTGVAGVANTATDIAAGTAKVVAGGAAFGSAIGAVSSYIAGTGIVAGAVGTAAATVPIALGLSAVGAGLVAGKKIADMTGLSSPALYSVVFDENGNEVPGELRQIGGKTITQGLAGGIDAILGTELDTSPNTEGTPEEMYNQTLRDDKLKEKSKEADEQQRLATLNPEYQANLKWDNEQRKANAAADAKDRGLPPPKQ